MTHSPIRMSSDLPIATGVSPPPSPLTDAELALVRTRFSARTTGTMYEGPSSQTTVTLVQRLSR
jgi:hypothetical protein